jgi:hypothetical protein
MGRSSTNIARTKSTFNTKKNVKEETTKGSFASTSVITIEDDQPNKGMEFVMETPEKSELQRKMLEKDDPMEEDVLEPLTKKMRIDSNFESEEESNKMKHLGKSLLEKLVVSITQIASSSDPHTKPQEE